MIEEVELTKPLSKEFHAVSGFVSDIESQQLVMDALYLHRMSKGLVLKELVSKITTDSIRSFVVGLGKEFLKSSDA